MARMECLNLTQQVAQELGKSIISGEFKQRTGAISEAMLCKEFEVSRTSVREAVKILTSKGLISSHPKQGIKVEPKEQWNLYDNSVLTWIMQSNPSLDLIYELLQLRLAIEPQAAALATQSIDAESLEQLTTVVNALQKTQSSTDTAFHELKAACHDIILSACNNRFLLQLKQVIKAAIHINHPEVMPRSSFLSLLGSYQRLVASLHEKDSGRARVAMQHLIDIEILHLEQIRHASGFEQQLVNG